MKYPEKQFKKLVEALPTLLNYHGITANDIEVTNIGLLCTLHCRVFQQKNYPNDNANVKFVNENRLMDIDETFLLYPEGCNDDHVITAMKTAIKQLQTN